LNLDYRSPGNRACGTVSEHELDFYFQKWRFTEDTGSFGTKEISFHLASELLLHVCKMLPHLILVVLKGYLHNLRGSQELMQRKAKASFTGPWGLEAISTQFARERTHFKERCPPECGQYQVENPHAFRIRSSV